MNPPDSAITVAREQDIPASSESNPGETPPREAADAGSARDAAAPAPPRAAPDPPAPAPDQADPAADQGLRALGRAALSEHDVGGAPGTAGTATGQGSAGAPAGGTEAGRSDEAERKSFDIARVAWLVTVLSLLLAVAILMLNGYAGYAGVTLAVALAAAINLL